MMTIEQQITEQREISQKAARTNQLESIKLQLIEMPKRKEELELQKLAVEKQIKDSEI